MLARSLHIHIRVVPPLIVLAALLFAVPVHPAPMVKAVRHGVSGERTRVVIDLSAGHPYEVVPVAAPDRVAINIPGARAAKAFKPIDVSRGAIKRVRVNRLSWGSQIVLDLRGKATWQDFHLAAVENMPHRIVIDVFGTAPEDVITEVTESGRPHSTPVPAKRQSPSKKVVAPQRDLVVAVDAGHGGKDPGSVGRGGITEKREALAIARLVAAEINTKAGYKAVLTRERDVFISLPKRTQIAQRKGADIFVSIHLNSAPRKSARGIEVFFLSPGGAKNTARRFLRNTKRAAAELGVHGSSSPAIVQMLVDVNQQSMMQRSALLAESILKAVDRKGLPPVRSIKQKAFVVLKSITMPSVMVETGFVTNARDARILKSKAGKAKLARSISKGIVSFLKAYPPAIDETGRILVHRVRRGDTLWRISREYNTSVGSIQKANKLGTSKMIRIGQELVIREGYAAN